MTKLAVLTSGLKVSLCLVFVFALPIKSSAAGTVVRQESGSWLIENPSIRVTVDVASGRISVLDRRCMRLWSQANEKAAAFRNLRPLPDGVAFDADFGFTANSPNTVTVSLHVPDKASDLSVTAEMADSTSHRDGFFFLEPFVLETPDAVMAVADYCDGHLYPLTEENLGRGYFDGGRLDLPFVGVCDLKAGFGYSVILETSDDAWVECRRYTVEGRKVYAPRVGWQPSKGSFRYSRRLLYHFAATGGYVALAKGYRAYAQQQGLIVPFTEKVKRNPNIRRLFGAPDVWGDASLTFAQQAKAAGVDKMLIHGRSDPKDMKAIGALGYLPSEYDNYTDVLPVEPGQQPDSNHDRIPEAVVMKADGTRMTAWLTYDKKTQYMKRCPALWAVTARHVIPELLKTYPYLGRFIDVTTAEALYECYDESHPLTKSDKRKAGEDLLEVVRNNGLVVGGEHGIWWGVPHQDYIEGMMSGNRFAWPAGHLIHPKDRQEKFSGPYGTESWETYDRWSLGHEWRAPLWELVFHDCVVSTWYWGDSNDYLMQASPETIAKKDAFNVLYGTMPMLWADSAGAWVKDRETFLRTYRNVCRLHETVAEADMLSHEFLTPDHALQRTRFSNGTVCVVNFGTETRPVTLDGKTYLLPQNGWAVKGPHFEQSRALSEGVVTTRISEPGYASEERNGHVVTSRSLGNDRISVQISGNDKSVELQPELIQSNWDLHTTHAFALDSDGTRLRQASLTLSGRLLNIDVGNSRNIELVSGSIAKAPDLQIDASGMSFSPGRPMRQGEIFTAHVRVQNLGGAAASHAHLTLYADQVRPENRLAEGTLSIGPGGNQTVDFRVNTSSIDGPRRLIAVASSPANELCMRNNSASRDITVIPDFARWPNRRVVRVDAGDVGRQDATVEIQLSDVTVNPVSVRVAACDEAGKSVGFVPSQIREVSRGTWAVCFTVPSDLASGQSRKFNLLYAAKCGPRFVATGASSWDGPHQTYRGETYEAHFENGVLRDIGAPGHPAMSHLMFSSKETGWTDEPGTVTRFTALEDGPVRTVVNVRKRLLAGVMTDKTFTFYRDRFEIAGGVTGGFGVFSRAYFKQSGTYLDSGGFTAKVDGEGEAEGVSNRAKNPKWYSVTGDGWAQTCVALSPASDITYWDDNGSWGGVGFNESPMQGLRFCYVFHVTKGDSSAAPTIGELDARRLTKPVMVSAE